MKFLRRYIRLIQVTTMIAKVAQGIAANGHQAAVRSEIFHRIHVANTV